MEKHILTEINRTREIMGLGQLIREQSKVYAGWDTIEMKSVLKKHDRYVSKKKKGYYKVPSSVLQLQNFAEAIDSDIIPSTTETAAETFALLLECLLGHHAGGGRGKNSKQLLSKRDAKVKMLALISNPKKEASININVEPFSVYNHPGGGGIASHGNLNAEGKWVTYERETNGANRLQDILLYVNGYNMLSYAIKKGAAPQYLLEGMIVEETVEEYGTGNFVDLTAQPEPSDVLNIYSSTEAKFLAIEKKDKIKKGPDEAGYKTDGKYNNNYTAGEYIPSDRKELDRAINEVVQLFTPDVLENLTNFSVTSSASDEYGYEDSAKTKPIHHGASNGSGDPGEGTDNKTKNEYLAYQRGKYFLEELIKGIKAEGHPGLPNPTVNWKVQVGGPEQRFIDINLNAYKETKEGKRWIETDFDYKEGHDETSSGWKKGTVYHYTLDLEIKGNLFKKYN